MTLMIKDFLFVFVGLFVALDIIGTLPIYVGLTQNLDAHQRKIALRSSILTALIVAVVFMFVGEQVFTYMGITLADFRIAGGLVLLLISLADLLGKSEHQSRAKGDTGIVPLAVPLITGPAVLTTLLIQYSTFGWALTLLSLLLNYSIGWLLLEGSDRLQKLLGRDSLTVLSKIAALLLAAIAVAMIRAGLK